MAARILDPNDKVQSGAAGDKALAVVNSGIALAGAAVAQHVGEPLAIAALTAAAQHFTRTLLGPILSNGLTDFVNDLAARIQRLEDEGKLRVDELLTNESFVEALGAATRLAPFTLRDEKRTALRNAVLNSALSRDMDALEQQIFFGFIERFTELHLIMLKLLKDPNAWPGINTAASAESQNRVLRTLLTSGLPQLAPRPFLADQVWLELRSNNLVEGAESLDNWGEGSSLRRKRTTEFADRFLAFISSPF